MCSSGTGLHQEYEAGTTTTMYNYVKRPEGIEPSFTPWQGAVLPLNEGRTDYLPTIAPGWNRTTVAALRVQHSSTELQEHVAESQGVEPCVTGFGGLSDPRIALYNFPFNTVPKTKTARTFQGPGRGQLELWFRSM